jgi:hypothetical protein
MSWLFQSKSIIHPFVPTEILSMQRWPNVYDRIRHYIYNQSKEFNIHYKKIRIGDIVANQEILCPITWGNITYCRYIHSQFLDAIENNNVSNYTQAFDTPLFELKKAEPVSINACAWLGSGLRIYTEKYGPVYADENWWTIYLPIWSQKNNAVYTSTIVSHYSYYRQRELGLDQTDILNRYEEFVKK